MTDTEFQTFVERATAAPPELRNIFNDFWRDTVSHYNFFADLRKTKFKKMDEIVFSLQNFLIQTESDVKQNEKALRDHMYHLRMKQGATFDERLEAARAEEALESAHAIVAHWYADNHEPLTHLKLLVGAYILYASGIDLKKTP